MPPSMGRYQQPHTKRWAAKIASLDAFVFVSPEYNHGIPAALKNAIDFLFAEWKNKATGFVSYGGAGGGGGGVGTPPGFWAGGMGPGGDHGFVSLFFRLLKITGF